MNTRSMDVRRRAMLFLRVRRRRILRTVRRRLGRLITFSGRMGRRGYLLFRTRSMV